MDWQGATYRATKVRRIAVGLVACIALSATIQAQGQASSNSLPGSEGALSNDVFLPSIRQAEEFVERGDLLLEQAVTSQDRTAVFEAWRSALTSTIAGDSIARSERDTLGIEAALWQRLVQLQAEHRAEWITRFNDLAQSELISAGSNAMKLASTARRNPATRAAVLACLKLADLRFEEGALFECSAWCQRALQNLDPSHMDAEVLKIAINKRLELADSIPVPLPNGTRSPKYGFEWQDASQLSFLTRVDFGKPVQVDTRNDGSYTGPPTGVRSGLTFLIDGRIAVQSPRRVTIVRATGNSIESSFEPTLLLPDSVAVSPINPRWSDDRHQPLLPVAVGNDLILVHGRPFGPIGGENALMSIKPPSSPPAQGLSRPGLPALNWAIVGNLRVDHEGVVHEEPELDKLADALFENGPVIVGTRVFACLRENEDEVRIWLACFDLATGRCLWTRRLAQGDGLQPGADGRGRPLPANPSQALVASGRYIFIGTNIGAGLLVDSLDGQLIFGFKNRKRSAGIRGWRTNWSAFLESNDSPLPSILWAPLDSDFEYLLGGSESATSGPLQRAPREIGESLALLGGDDENSITLSMAGPRRVISNRQSRDGARFDSPFLGREETFGGRAAISPSRIVFSTDRGLYLLDRERELYLLDYQTLPAYENRLVQLAPGGDVYARGARIFVLGEASLWTFLVQ
ncbi:MAG: hypothetical protein ACI8TQ_001641 [Planctomycetota bacterium]|jgi:hypothetical protein